MRQAIPTLLIALLALGCGACRAAGGSAPGSPPFQVGFQPADATTAAALDPVLRADVVAVERYFGAPFQAPFRITIHPDRAAFDASFPPDWGVGRTECWMVASGVADG